MSYISLQPCTTMCARIQEHGLQCADFEHQQEFDAPGIKEAHEVYLYSTRHITLPGPSRLRFCSLLCIQQALEVERFENLEAMMMS